MRSTNVDGNIALEITQGGVINTDSPGMLRHIIPAGGKVTITGSATFPSGTFKSPAFGSNPNNRIYDGNSFVLDFGLQDDGTELSVQGALDESDPNTLSILIAYRTKDADGKPHTATAASKLTRQ